MIYELKPTDAQGQAEQRQHELRGDRCTRCDADLDPGFAVDGFCDERCNRLYDEEQERERDDEEQELDGDYDPFDDDRTELYRDRSGNEYWRRPQ